MDRRRPILVAALVGVLALAALAACTTHPPPAARTSEDPDTLVLDTERVAALGGSMLPCDTHCDCEQGEFCYKGTCLRDDTSSVYCCTKPGCMPGAGCFTPEATRSRCGEDPDWPCATACDCGPAHACLEVDGAGPTCVKDGDDPWIAGASVFGVAVPEGEPTYCFTDFSTCTAGLTSYVSQGASGFAAYDPYTATARGFCGGVPCMYAGDCGTGAVCADTRVLGTATPHGSCDRAGGFCISGAAAEAILGYAPYDLLSGCDDVATPGVPCEAGWRSAGVFVVEMIVGTAGSCGDGACAAWESPESCPADCSCGDGVCSGTEAIGGSCVLDCGTCGDGFCTSPESPKNCPSDCAAAAGDGSCAPSEAWDCPNADCGCAASAAYRDWPGHCGDGVCQRGGDIPEHGGNCPLDCPEPTLASETAGLSERIADLRAAGRLSAGVAKALRTKVGRVAWLAVRGETTGARGVLAGLRVQIEALSGIQVDPLDAVGLLELVDLIEVLLAGGG